MAVNPTYNDEAIAITMHENRIFISLASSPDPRHTQRYQPHSQCADRITQIVKALAENMPVRQ